MSLSNSAESDLLKLLFNNTSWANVGDATGIVGSTAAGSFYVSLHTADPGETGDQTTSETAYTNYLRVAVARTTGGWTVSGTAPTQVANAAVVTFATGGASGSTLTHFAIGRASSGAGEIIASAVLTNPLVVGSGVVPSFAIGALAVTAD